jgi:molybdopterin-guanine dinucleotide biosynthesis protein B
MIPVLGFAAYSGTGKTTLIEQIIPRLKNEGIRLAVIKHDAHGLKFDKEGKDSWRFSNAGADYTIVNGPEQSAIFVQRSLSLEETISMINDADLILIEGYKTGEHDKIGISRMETGKGFPDDPRHFKALVTDDASYLERTDADLPPVFALDDVEGITNWILDTYIREE